MGFVRFSNIFWLLAAFYSFHVLSVANARRRVAVILIHFESRKSVALYNKATKNWIFPTGIVHEGERSKIKAARYADMMGVVGSLHLLETQENPIPDDPTSTEIVHYYVMDVATIQSAWRMQDFVRREMADLARMRDLYRTDVESNSEFWRYTRVFLSRNSAYDKVGLLCTVPFTGRYATVENIHSRQRKYPSDVVLATDIDGAEGTAGRIATVLMGIVPENVFRLGLNVNFSTNAVDLMYFSTVLFMLPAPSPLPSLLLPSRTESFRASNISRRWLTIEDMAPLVGGSAPPSFIYRLLQKMELNAVVDEEKVEIVCVDFEKREVLYLVTDLFSDEWTVPMIGWVHEDIGETNSDAAARTAHMYGGVDGDVYALDSDLFLVDVKMNSNTWHYKHAITEKRWLSYETVAPMISNARANKFLSSLLNKTPTILPFDQMSIVCYKTEPRRVLLIRNNNDNRQTTSTPDVSGLCYPRGRITNENGEYIGMTEWIREATGVEGAAVELNGLHFEDLEGGRHRVHYICVVRYGSDVADWESRYPSSNKVWIPGEEGFDYLNIKRSDSFVMRALEKTFGII